MTDQDREVRTLKWQLKQLGKQLGRAGATIYQLRCEVAALRSVGQVTMGDYLRLLKQKQEVEAENRVLREKLDTK